MSEQSPLLSRRGLLGALICAPAIVRASSLMPVKQMFAELPPLQYEVITNSNGLLTIQMITSEARKLWTNANAEMLKLNVQHIPPEACLQQPIFLVKLPHQQQMTQGNSQAPQALSFSPPCLLFL